VETIAKISSTSVTGRLIYKFADRFYVQCQTFAYLKTVDKEKYYYKRPGYWWMKILGINCKKAILLFSEMLKTCGLWYTFISIMRSVPSCIKRFWFLYKWKKNKNCKFIL